MGFSGERPSFFLCLQGNSMEDNSESSELMEGALDQALSHSHWILVSHSVHFNKHLWSIFSVPCTKNAKKKGHSKFACKCKKKQTQEQVY